MNILYTVLWTDNEELPRASFQRLRDAVARGERLPFDGPYEVALVREPTGQVAVAVLALTANAPIAGDAASSLPEFTGWFARMALTGGAPAPSYDAQPAQHLKLASELGPSALVLENFGTFVGEPDEAAPGVAAPGMAAPGMAAAPVVMVAPVQPAPAAAPFQAVAAAAPAPARVPIPPVAPAAAAQTGLSSGCATALRVTLLVGGILLLVGGVCVGSLGVIGYFIPSSNIDPQTDTGNFILGMAVCFLPVILAGGVLVVIGILLPRWLKGKQAV